MITIIYSTHKDEVYNNNFKNHLMRSVGLDGVQILQYLGIDYRKVLQILEWFLMLFFAV